MLTLSTTQVLHTGTIVNIPSSRDYKKISDEDLIVLIMENNRSDLFNILYDRYADKVYRKCISFVKDPDIAKDMVQDVLLKVFTKLNKFKGKSRFSTWLYAITYNYCVEYYRKNSRYSMTDIDEGPEFPDKGDDNDTEFLGERVERLKKAMERIAPDDKVILTMKYQEEGSIKDLMEHLDISESAVKMRLARARKRVRQLIVEEEAI